MNVLEFTQLLKENDLEVTFTKISDGKERVMRCSSNIPEEKLSPEKLGKTKPEGLITVYDIEKNEWRSLYVDSISNIKKLDSSFGLLQEKTE